VIKMTDRNGERPRFHPQDEKKLGPVPEGFELRKFHGRPVLLPATNGQELIVGGQFTERQYTELVAYERIRRGGLSPTDFTSDNYYQRVVVANMFEQ
jgi:hypothetical protein